MSEQPQDVRSALEDHLQEIRNRLIKSVVFVLIIACAFYSFVPLILQGFAAPVGNLVFIEPQEAFITNIKIAFWAGLFFSSPFILYQIWAFVSVGLSSREKKYVALFGPFSFALFVLGVCFGYFIIVPVGIKFLLGFATDMLTPMITFSKYVSFTAGLMLNFGLVFELPLVLAFLTKVGVTTPTFLADKRRHAIVLLFLLAAMFTPPDVVTQCLMAVPLLGLYELGIIFSKMAYKKHAG